MSQRPRDRRVTHRCVACGRDREISLGALRMIENGERAGRCKRCTKATTAPPVVRPRFKGMLSDDEIQAWARETWDAMGDKDRQDFRAFVSLVLDDTRGVAA